MSIFGLFTAEEIAEALREIGWTVISPERTEVIRETLDPHVTTDFLGRGGG